MVMGGDLRPKVVGSNPSGIYWMDMTFFTLTCCKKCIVCLKRLKINEKEARVGPFLKKTIRNRFVLFNTEKPVFVSQSRPNAIIIICSFSFRKIFNET